VSSLAHFLAATLFDCRILLRVAAIVVGRFLVLCSFLLLFPLSRSLARIGRKYGQTDRRNFESMNKTISQNRSSAFRHSASSEFRTKTPAGAEKIVLWQQFEDPSVRLVEDAIIARQWQEEVGCHLEKKSKLPRILLAGAVDSECIYQCI